MLGRLLLLGLLLLALTAIFPDSDRGLYLFIAVAFVITIPYAFWLRRDKAMAESGPLQFIVDVLVITGLVHFTGGISSPLTILYPLAILTAGIVFSGRHALQVALFSMLLYSMLIILEMKGYLPWSPGTDALPMPYDNTATVLRDLLMNVLIFCFFAVSTAFITNRCFWQDEELKRLQSVGKLVFDKVTAPLLAVRPSGEIVLANSASVRLFGLADVGDHPQPLASLFPGKAPAFKDVAGCQGTIWEMRRPDGGSLRCLLEIERVNIPFVANLIPLMKHETDFYFLVFKDMTEFLNQERLRENRQRLYTAAGVVAEVAHEVRNPLTALKSAGELRSETAEALAREQRDVSGNDWAVINSICNVISEETGRLDYKVQVLLECASRDPEKLLELTNNANNWMERLPLYGKRGEGQQDSDR